MEAIRIAGKRYSWAAEVTLSDETQRLTFTDENATIDDFANDPAGVAATDTSAESRDGIDFSSDDYQTPAAVQVVRVSPVLPEGSKAFHQKDSAILQFEIAPDGHVRSVNVTRSSNAEAREAAVAAVSQWLYVPAREGRRAVSTSMKLRIDFRDR